MTTMQAALEDWLERNSDRRAAGQRAQIETAKLLATFSVGVAAAIVASALQVGKAGGTWNLVAVSFLAAAFLGVLVVIMLDRTTEVDQDTVLLAGRARGWTSQRIVDELRVSVYTSTRNNEIVVATVKRATQTQVLLAILAGTAATISLLH